MDDRLRRHARLYEIADEAFTEAGYDTNKRRIREAIHTVIETSYIDGWHSGRQDFERMELPLGVLKETYIGEGMEGLKRYMTANSTID